jgi:hypothetical protein
MLADKDRLRFPTFVMHRLNDAAYTITWSIVDWMRQKPCALPARAIGCEHVSGLIKNHLERLLSDLWYPGWRTGVGPLGEGAWPAYLVRVSGRFCFRKHEQAVCLLLGMGHLWGWRHMAICWMARGSWIPECEVLCSTGEEMGRGSVYWRTLFQPYTGLLWPYLSRGQEVGYLVLYLCAFNGGLKLIFKY